MWIDTHIHWYDEQFAPDRNEVIRKALEAGVEKMFIPNCDRNTIPGMLQLEADWPEHCFGMMGLHPCYVKDDYLAELKLVEEWLEKRSFAAVGEIGLDYYWDRSYDTQQEEAFVRQVELAQHYGLPVVIHSRESLPRCIEIIARMQKGRLTGIFHCFSGTLEEAEQIRELGFYLGIGGVVTFRKSQVREVVARMRLDAFVLETDAPYLAPVPYRGKRNDSSYIPLIASEVAMLKQCTEAEVAAVTTANSEKIFRNCLKKD